MEPRKSPRTGWSGVNGNEMIKDATSVPGNANQKLKCAEEKKDN